MLRSLLFVSALAALCCCVASAAPSPAFSTWLTGEIVAIEISNADPSIVTVVVYDPLTGSALSSDPIPGWWGDDASVILDGTSAKSVAWSGDIESAAPEAYIAFFIQNNASEPTQAFFTYQFSDASGYITPVAVGSCFSKAPLLTDLQYFSAQDGQQPFAAAYVDMTQVSSDTPFSFVTVTLPSVSNLSASCEINTLSTSLALPLPVPWSVSAVVTNFLPSWTPLIWAYIGYTNSTRSDGSAQQQFEYSINFVQFEAGATPDPIPLTGALAPSKLPPEPWFSLQLLPNTKQLGRQTGTDMWLINSLDQTVWAIRLFHSQIQQVLVASTNLPFVVPTIPVAVTWTATESPDESRPIFLHLNDYKQLMGACPSNASISITGVNLPVAAWGQKLNFLIPSSETLTIALQ